jgi:predicted DNA-binding ribbon-helix-helix protein
MKMEFPIWAKTDFGFIDHADNEGTSRHAISAHFYVVCPAARPPSQFEDEFWNSLKEIAAERGMTVAELVAAIDGNRQHANLSSAIRLFVLGVYRDQRR